jgi:hypothetical protein
VELLLATCHYNPCGYRRPLENYWRFRKALGRDDILRTVEVSFNGRFEISDALHVEANPTQVMWQKERCLNLLVERFDPDVYAWLDADLLFSGPDWPEKALVRMGETPVLQLFSGIVMQDETGFPESFRHSIVAHRLSRTGQALTSPGGAWMARRDVLPKIPFDDNIVGGGDDAFARALLGDWEAMVPRMPGPWLRRYLQESVPLYRSLRGRTGYHNQTVTHLWHGRKEDRQYVERHRILAENGFDPAEDVRIAKNGLWEWASDKPALHDAVKRYFEGRAEDGVVVASKGDRAYVEVMR